MHGKMDKAALLGRIRALQAKTVQNGCTEAEAYAAADLAARLIDKFGFEESDFEAPDLELSQDTSFTGDLILGGVLYTCPALFEYCDVRGFTTKMGKKRTLTIFGKDTDVLLCRYLLDVFSAAIAYEWAEYLRAVPKAGRIAGNSKLRKSFKLGMGTRISERLREMKSVRNARTDEGGSGRTGKDLVVVKDALVTEAFSKKYPHLRPGRKTHSEVSYAAYAAGLEAGNRVQIMTGIGADQAKLVIAAT